MPKPILFRSPAGIFRVFCLGLLLLAGQESAQAQASAPSATEEAGDAPALQVDALAQVLRTQMLGNPDLSSSAPVVVNGKELFRLRGISTVPARKRARLIGERIEALAADTNFDPESIRVEERGRRHDFYAGPSTTLLFSILQEDAELELIGREILSELALARVKDSINEYRRDRQPEVVRANVYRALLRTFGLVLTLLVVNWIFGKTDIWLENQLKRRITNIEVKSLSIIRAEQIWNIFRVAIRIVRGVIFLLIAYLFLTSVLNMFPWTRYFAQTTLSYVTTPLKSMAGAVIGYVPSLIFLILLYFVTRYLLKLVYRYFYALGRGKLSLSGFDPDWSLPTYRIVRTLIILMALVLAYPYIPGSDSEAFKGISIMAGVLFSLGSTSVISNIIAGYTMTYRRAFKVGDRVRIGEVTGDVLEMRLLVTHLRSLKNEEVVVPNSSILNNEVINYSKLAASDGLILHTTVGIGYEVPWRQVEAMLLQAAGRTRGLSKKPAPFVLQKALSDFAVNYELNAYCRDEKKAMSLYSNLHRNIQDVFNEHGVSIMTPAYVADTEEPKIVPEDQWYAPPAEKPETA